jgi:3',5'-cyclic AMP phosphodiesterase CpdA
MHSPSRRAFLQTTALAGAGTLFCGRLVGAEQDLRFGLVADAQYADAPPSGVRHYRRSLEKLSVCVAAFNEQNLDFAIHLGDFIDRNFASYADILPVYRKLKAPGYFALGNHDFAVPDGKKGEVPKTLGMKARYYDFSVKGWRLAVLDGNEVSLMGTTKGSPERAKAQAKLNELKEAGASHARTYNGGVSEAQLAWLDKVLADADGRGQPAVVFCHFPVYPMNALNLWNREEVIAVLEKHSSVVAYINGHDHAGNYGVKQGIHYLTVNGMVDTPDTTAYGIASQAGTGVNVSGTGRLKDHQFTHPA